MNSTTTYEFYVRADCGSGDVSYWSSSVLQSTNMAAVDIPYTTDFSTQDWMLNNGSCTNIWHIGVPSGETDNALFISNDGSSAGYNLSSASTVSAEKLFNMTDAEYMNISFDVQCGGESSWDYLKVFLAPATEEYPAATTAPSYAANSYSTYAMDFSDYLSQTGSSSYPYKLNLTQGNTLQVSIDMPNPDPNGLAKLVFVWKNDGSQGTQPGAIIRNVSIDEAVVGIEDVTLSDNSVSLMPNPADNYIDLRVNGNAKANQAMIYNTSGQLVQTVTLTDNHVRIDLSSMASGMYFVRVMGDNTTITKKFIRK